MGAYKDDWIAEGVGVVVGRILFMSIFGLPVFKPPIVILIVSCVVEGNGFGGKTKGVGLTGSGFLGASDL